MARRRRGGLSAREAMHAKRAAPLEVDPAPPGPVGGHYRPLSDADVARILDAALEILATIGMGEAPRVLVEQACSVGAEYGDDGRLRFPRSLIEDTVAGAARRFVFPGRDPSTDIEVGGDRVYFGTGGAAVQTLDLDTQLYRASTLADLHDFTRLIDALPNVSWFTRCCVATDVEDTLALDRHTAFALLCNTGKPVGTSFTLAEHVDPIVDMFDYALGGEGAFRRRPFCKAHISPVISPLRFGEDAVDVAIACMRRGVIINNIVAAQSGATSPATLAGMLATTLAETLAALAMVNVFEPGYPMVFSNWPLVIDLRTGAFAGGGGEIALLNAASAQLSNHLGLPSGAACSMSDAKAIDAQMGMEKALSATAVGLAGCNMVYESSGMTASLLGASFEAFVLDNDMLGNVYRVMRGVEVNADTLNLDAIREAVFGEGHFLGGQQTLDAMQRDYFYPKLADRDEPRTWAQNGAQDAWHRARDEARRILAEHQPPPLPAPVERALRRDLGLPERGG
ncbi:MAG: trimethylamine methyltransferase family protein [Pseudomonadota bacterium]